MNSLSGQKLQVNGEELYYIEKGKGSHAVLCIPGALSPCEWSFASQLEHFGRENSDYKIIAFDPRGYGYSRPYDRKFTFKDGEHHLKTDAIDAYHLMKKLGFSTFSVLGWCDGGVTGIFLTALFPSAVTKLVLWGSRTYITEHDVKTSEEFEKIDKWGVTFREAWLPVYGGASKIITLQKEFTAALNGFLAVSESSEICAREMSEIECPTLILHGEKDDVSPMYHAEHMNKSIKRSELQLLEDGKHTLQMGRTSKQFNRLVEEFLSSKPLIV